MGAFTPATAAPGDRERALLEACSLEVADCLARLDSRETGLSAAEAEQERQQVGPNEVAVKKGGALRRAFRRIVNPLVVLAQDREAVAQLETVPDLAGPLSARAPFDRAGYRIITRSVSSFQPDRLPYDCIAVKLGPGQKK